MRYSLLYAVLLSIGLMTRIEKLHRVDFELQHLGGFSAVVASFALHGDTAKFQVAGSGEFHRAVAVELDRVRRRSNDPLGFVGRLALAHASGY